MVFIQVDYKDTEGTAFKIEIADETYTGSEITQVQGKAVLEYPKVKTMDMLRGSVLKMQLEADTSSTYYTRLIETVGDKRLTVTFYRDGSVFWNGFIKPDGIVESFVHDYWIINIQAIDGLGLIENILFLDEDGDAYKGAMSELGILARCLELTGQTMDFRVYYHNLYFTVDDTGTTAPTLAQQAIFDTYVNTERYVKDDKEATVFTVKEVLESLLKKYGSFITQHNNKWNIIRLVDLMTTSTTFGYSQYEVDGTYQSDAQTNFQTALGSDIDSYDPCHAGANQQKTYKAALGAYKVHYDYGLIKSVLYNPKMLFNDALGDIDGWTLQTTTADWNFEVNDDGDYIGQMLADTSSGYTSAIVYDYSSFNNDVIEADTLKINIAMQVFEDCSGGIFFSLGQKCRITLFGDSGTTYYLNTSGEWTLSSATIFLYKRKYTGFRLNNLFKSVTTISSNGLPEDGTMSFEFYFPYVSTTDYGTYAYVESVNIGAADDGVSGESWTSQRNYAGNGTATAIVDVEDKVFVGDNDGDVYVGALEDSSTDNTVLWSKAISGVIDDTKQFPLLNWLSRDRLQISGGNSTIFRGGILGYLPYLGVLSINNIEGLFITTAWSYDTANNKIEAEHERIFTDDIYDDVSVSYQLESENVVRPAIE